jgi:hypothetical protein
MKGDAEVKIRMYVPTSKELVYSRELPSSSEPIKILDFQILSAVKVKPEKKDLSFVKIAQSDANKMSTYFDDKIDLIKERLGISDDEDEENSDREEVKKDAVLKSDSEEEAPVLVAKRVLKAEKVSAPARAKTTQRKAEEKEDE